MGRCASVLNSSNYEKLAAQRAANEIGNAESDVLTFSIECFYFDEEDEDAVDKSKAKLFRTWQECATAEGIQLGESTAKKKIVVSLSSRHSGHHVIVSIVKFVSVNCAFFRLFNAPLVIIMI